MDEIHGAHGEGVLHRTAGSNRPSWAPDVQRDPPNRHPISDDGPLPVIELRCHEMDYLYVMVSS